MCKMMDADSLFSTLALAHPTFGVNSLLGYHSCIYRWVLLLGELGNSSEEKKLNEDISEFSLLRSV